MCGGFNEMVMFCSFSFKTEQLVLCNKSRGVQNAKHVFKESMAKDDERNAHSLAEIVTRLGTITLQ